MLQCPEEDISIHKITFEKVPQEAVRAEEPKTVVKFLQLWAYVYNICSMSGGFLW